MRNLTSRFDIGDVIWTARVFTERLREKCPTCKGERYMAAAFPDGRPASAPCPDCNGSGYGKNSPERLRGVVNGPLTVGRVEVRVTAVSAEFNQERGREAVREEYMAYETGVGSGSTYSGESDQSVKRGVFGAEPEATAFCVRHGVTDVEVCEPSGGIRSWTRGSTTTMAEAGS